MPAVPTVTPTTMAGVTWDVNYIRGLGVIVATRRVLGRVITVAVRAMTMRAGCIDDGWMMRIMGAL